MREGFLSKGWFTATLNSCGSYPLFCRKVNLCPNLRSFAAPTRFSVCLFSSLQLWTASLFLLKQIIPQPITATAKFYCGDGTVPLVSQQFSYHLTGASSSAEAFQDSCVYQIPLHTDGLYVMRPDKDFFFFCTGIYFGVSEYRGLSTS